MADIVMKLGDRLPSIEYVLVGTTGPIDLSQASGVSFNFELASQTGTVKGGACVIVDASGGKVRYDWAAVDTDTVGVYNAEFVANFAGKEMTFPVESPKFLELEVEDDVS